MRTGAAYIRVSTEDQVEFSPDSQMKKIQEYAKSHEIALPEQNFFLDEGISGRSAAKRPGFQRMIGMAKKKPRPFDVILVWKYSRFARSRQDSILYKSMLRRECGIDVVSITEQLSADPTSILVEALLEAMDEYYSINLAQEVKRGMNEKFSRGGVVSGPPFGYRMGEGVFVADEETGPLVPWMFQSFLKGASFRQIAAELNGMGVRSIRGNLFESRTVEYILSNPVYAGRFRRNPGGADKKDRYHRGADVLVVEGGHEPLVSPESFGQVQEEIARREKARGSHGRAQKAAYMLRGLVRCSCCGGTLTRTEQGRSLQCCRYARGQCRESHQVRIEKLNRAVLFKLEEDLEDLVLEGTVERTYAAPAAEAAKALPLSEGAAGPVRAAGPDEITEALLRKEKKRLERAKAAYEDGVDTLEEYQKEKEAILGRMAEWEKRIGQEEPHVVPKYSVPFRELLKRLDSENLKEAEKNEVLRSFVKQIVFWRSSGFIEITYYL